MKDDKKKPEPATAATPAATPAKAAPVADATAQTEPGELELANKKIQELTEAAKRALADLTNYRKRAEEEKSAFVKFANITLILELLPVLDNFARAFAQVPEDVAKTEWFKGALQIEQQLIGIIKKQGIEEMPSSIGQKLDPTKHEAIGAGPGEKDIVIEEYEKGYLIDGKVIRPAKVRVGNGI